jgi:bifunctional autolysin
MAFTETPKEKEKRLAFYAKNKAVADDKEAKANAEIKRKFNETTNTDTSKNTNPMGDTYKKGGKIMSKKTKRYEDGGEVEFETKQGKNENIDSGVRSRAMAAMEKGSSDEAPAKKSAPAPKKAEAKEEPKAASRSKDSAFKDSSSSFKDSSSFKGSSPSFKGTPSSFKDSSSTLKDSSSSFKDSSSSFKGNAFKNAKSSFKSGGSVGSASRRADGCAVKGKTKGRMV